MSCQLSAAPAPESQAGDAACSGTPPRAVPAQWPCSELALCFIAQQLSILFTRPSVKHAASSVPVSPSSPEWQGLVRGHLLCLLCWLTPLPGAWSAGLGVTESRLPSSSRHTAHPLFSWRNPRVQISSPGHLRHFVHDQIHDRTHSWAPGPLGPPHPVGEQRPCEGCKLELGSVLDACPHPDSKSVLPTSPFVLDLPLHVSPALRLVPWTRARYLGSQLPRWAPQPLCTATRGVF